MKRWLVSLGLVFGVTAPCWGAIAVDNHTFQSSGGGAAITATTINVATGNTIVVCGNTTDTGLNTPTDNVTTNTYTAIAAEQTLGGGQRNRCWIAENVNGSAVMAFTLTSNGVGLVSIFVVEVTGMSASPLDTSSVTADATEPYTSAGLTPSQANILLLAFTSGESAGGAATYTPGNSFVTIDQETDGDNFYNGFTSSRNVTSIAAYSTSVTSTPDFTDSSNWIIALKDATAGGGTSTFGFYKRRH